MVGLSRLSRIYSNWWTRKTQKVTLDKKPNTDNVMKDESTDLGAETQDNVRVPGVFS